MMGNEGVSTMIEKPNCSTCTIKRCPMFSYDGGKPTDSSVHSQQRLAIEKVGCLSHPGAREYLMKDVIKELERLSECNYGTDTGRKYAAVHVKVISLIRDGVKK